MTRQQFDQTFAASDATTEGFTDAQLASINDAVFSEVVGLDIDDRETEWHVGNAFKTEFDRY